MNSLPYKTLYHRAQVLNLLGRELARVSRQLDSPRVIRLGLRRIGEALQADVAIQADLRRTDGNFERPYTLTLKSSEAGRIAHPDGAPADRFLDTCREFLRRPTSPPESDLLLLRIDSDDRPVAVLGFRRPGRHFSRSEARFGQDAAIILSENLSHRQRERAETLKARIYAKTIAEMRPEDVLYQILHGLKRLLQYDHSAAVLLVSADQCCLTVQAEIISWTKAKSARIGERCPLTPEMLEWLRGLKHPVLLRAGEADESKTPGALYHLLHQNLPGVPPVRSMIMAALRHQGRDLGVLTVRSRSAAAFTAGDISTLDQFLPLASVTLYNSTLYKAQQDMLLSAERKTALADLARAISHDLNNAFGVMLPLLQTLRRDIQDKRSTPEQAERDLEVVEHYAGSSARIFQGLLSVAQGAAEPAHWSQLNPILEGILRMLGPNLESRHIETVREFDPSSPEIYLRRGEMEQLFLNFIYNARDAMPRGGTLTLRTRTDTGGVRVEVLDSGHGISEAIRGRIFEPFFTTKPTGSGLGLDICRSIVWDYDGRLELSSVPGQGTTVAVWLPRLAERLRAAAEGNGVPV